MPDHGRRRRSPARLLAPLALLLFAGALAAVILDFMAKQEDDGSERSQGQTAEQREPRQGQRPRPRRASYRVKLNDTLGLISEKTGVSVERLQELNPELDPQNLVVGQKIKLRE
jgi:LysM domain